MAALAMDDMVILIPETPEVIILVVVLLLPQCQGLALLLGAFHTPITTVHQALETHIPLTHQDGPLHLVIIGVIVMINGLLTLAQAALTLRTHPQAIIILTIITTTVEVLTHIIHPIVAHMAVVAHRMSHLRLLLHHRHIHLLRLRLHYHLHLRDLANTL